VRPGRRCRARAPGSGANEDLECLAVVHEAIALGDLFQAHAAVEDSSGVDLPATDVGHELFHAGAGGATSAAAPWTCSPPIPAAWPSTLASATGPSLSATSAASCSSTPRRVTCTPTGTTRSAAASPACAPWERYDVTRRTAPQKKTFHHPHVGTITLSFQGMQLEGTPGQRLGAYVAEPGTPDYDAMILLDITASGHREQSARRPH